MAGFDDLGINVDKLLRKTSRVNVLETRFGEGYSQRVTYGINNNKEVWTPQFKNRSLTDAQTIIAFFETQSGVQSFEWTPPGESTSVKVICKQWNETWVAPTVRTVTATFERVYEA